MNADGRKQGTLASFEVHDVRVSDKTVWRFLVLEDDMGRRGYGEFTFDGAPEDVSARMAQFAQGLIGKAADRKTLSGKEGQISKGLTAATIFSAAEQALVDIEARSAGLPLWRHLGAVEEIAEIPLYANINRRTVGRTQEAFAQSARDALADGFTRFKIAPFDGVLPGSGYELEIREGLERVGAVRDVIGASDLMIDCHWRFTTERIVGLMDDFARLGVCWLECPIVEAEEHIADIVEIRRVANSHGMRLAGLETAAGWEGFRPFVEAGAYDVIMPDIKHCGGYQAFLEIAGRAADLGVAVSAHNPTGPIAHLASLHAMAACGSAEPLEIQFDESLLFWELTVPPPPAMNGASSLPEGAGLGVELADISRFEGV